MKLLKFFNKSRKNYRGKKRKILLSSILAVNLLVGNLRSDSSKSQNYSKSPLTNERVIATQELTSGDNLYPLVKIVRTGNNEILEFQQESSYVSSHNKVILVNNDGNNNDDQRLPKEDNDIINNNPIRNRFFDVNPKHDKCELSEFDLKVEYQILIQEMAKKGYKIDCNQERFNDLLVNLQTGCITKTSLRKVKAALQGEAEGLYTNLRRPSNKAVKLDFEIDSPKGYTHVEYKTLIDNQEFEETYGISTKAWPKEENTAYIMGREIPREKERFCNEPTGPKSADNVLHVVNLGFIQDSNQKKSIIVTLLKGACKRGYDVVQKQSLL